ncbi:bifunctional metallophosphatase/5'-nucleotidase [Streptomyces venezuelae]|uniref:bifunctional metallophosphatase/5'-nucleotidase n=1 Tax=Streptomyces venezuelae TaxID=54571 RepID=UPI001CC23723|nr:bifunctional metallophosphatase/5'-nucleotidase [Streptomyces venezuelae]
MHEGEAAHGVAGRGDCDADGPGSRLRGRIKGIAERTPGAVDLIVSGHSHDSSAKVADRTVGHISADMPGRGSKEKETPLGSLLAGAQVEATRGERAELAFLNPGGMRAGLVRKGDGAITFADAFRTQPFGTPLVTMTLTGEQLLSVLREQFSGANADDPRFLQLSSAIKCSVDMGRTGAARLLTETVQVKGERVTAGKTYRVTVNDFLAGQGAPLPAVMSYSAAIFLPLPAGPTPLGSVRDGRPAQPSSARRRPPHRRPDPYGPLRRRRCRVVRGRHPGAE